MSTFPQNLRLTLVVWVQLPRTITFNPVARVLEQAPVEELQQLRGPASVDRKRVQVPAGQPVDLSVDPKITAQSEVVVTFQLPKTAANLSVRVGSLGGGSGHAGFPETTFMPDVDLVWTQDQRCKAGKTDAQRCAEQCVERTKQNKDAPCIGWVICEEHR